MNLTESDFAGHWQIDRQITDALGQQSGRFMGRAIMESVAPGRLDYAETGTLRLDTGPELQATRRYIWLFSGDSVVMQFADGRDFHDFVPTGESDVIRHLCGDDIYDVRYDFRQWPQWSAKWQVTGPRKDYVSLTRYLRS